MLELIALVVWTPLVSLLAAQQPAAQPKPPDLTQEAYVIEQVTSTYRFEKDGTGVRTRHMRIKVQSDAGVQAWGQLVLGYNSANEKIEIDFVRVRKADGTVVSAPLDAVQDLTSPVERDAPVYTDFRQKHVTVASLRPGETLEFKFTAATHTALAPGNFWTEYDFARQGAVLDEQLEIDVPADVAVTLRTEPGFDAKTSEAAGRRVYRWHGSHMPGNEEAERKAWVEARKNETDRPAVRLTTFQKWADVGKWYSALEASQRRPNDDLKRKAEELTKGIATPTEKAEALYDYVAKNFRYVSLSLGLGRYQPRGAPDVLRTEYGDCKDKHTLLASLLEAIGLHASAALMNSERKIDPDFPSPSQFDHVITRLAGNGIDLWMDTTTEVAPFRLLTANLRKKRALVVDATGSSHLEETPADPPMQSRQIADIDGRLDAAGTFNAHVRLEVRGDVEVFLRAVTRRTPRAQWKQLVERLSEQSGLSGEVSDYSISDPDDTRTPLVIDFKVAAKDYVDRSKKSSQIDLPLGDPDLPEFAKPEKADAEPKPLTLGAPTESRAHLRIDLDPIYAPKVPIPVAMARDFATYRADYALDGRVFSATRTLVVKQSELPASRASDYLAFRRVVQTDGKQGLALEAPVAAAVAPGADVKVSDLERRGGEAVAAGDYDRAVTIFKRILEMEPKNDTVWLRLAGVYSLQRDYEQSAAAYRHQIEVNPFDDFAYKGLGYTYLQQRRYADAEAQFRKQLEINPLDYGAHAGLGQLYLDWKKFADAIPALEKAASLAPQNTSFKVMLGKAYLNAGENDKAIAAFDKAIELDPSPGMWNDVAYELACRKAYPDRALRYAESAVSATTANSRNISVERVTARDLNTVSSLGAQWDTLGWVYFMSGDAAKAEPLVRAAWHLAHHAEVGDHLGQIYETLGRKDEAATMYALALNAERPLDETRDHLATLAGKDKVDALVRARKEEFARLGAVELAGVNAAAGSADFFVAFGKAGVEGVRFVNGDEPLKPLADAVRRLTFASDFPDDGPAKIVRRATVTCAAAPAGKPAACTYKPVALEDTKPDR
jgi:tetratricopeptide (TPR) repeat protein/transglutaminase-like putative cysteine protease